MKVLLIDDEPAVLKMYRLALEEAGYEVMTAAGGPEGLEAAQSQKPAIILLDIIMPTMNGFDVLADLKKNPETASIPVILLTNLPETTSGEKARQLGAVDYLVKAHVEPKELGQLLERYGEVKK